MSKLAEEETELEEEGEDDDQTEFEEPADDSQSEYEAEAESEDTSELEDDDEENKVPLKSKDLKNQKRVVVTKNLKRPVRASKNGRASTKNSPIVGKGKTTKTFRAVSSDLHVRSGSSKMTKRASPTTVNKRSPQGRAGSARIITKTSRSHSSQDLNVYLGSKVDLMKQAYRSHSNPSLKSHQVPNVTMNNPASRSNSKKDVKSHPVPSVTTPKTASRSNSTKDVKSSPGPSVRTPKTASRSNSTKDVKSSPGPSVTLNKPASRSNSKKDVKSLPGPSVTMNKPASPSNSNQDVNTREESPGLISNGMRTRGKIKKEKVKGTVKVDDNYHVPTEEFTDELKNLADVTDKKAHEPPPPIIISREQADNINQLAAQYTKRLMRDGFLQFRIHDFEDLDRSWWEKIFKVFHGSGFTMKTRNAPIKVSVQQLWRVSKHLFYTCTSDKNDALTDLPCLKTKTLGAVQDDLEKLFGGGDDPDERMRNFWRRLYQMEEDPKRTGPPLLVPYVNIYEYIEVENSTSRIGLNMNQLKTPLRDEIDENILNEKVDNDGITTSMTYFGFPGSFFCAHIEDASYNSYNIHAGGEPKFWNIVPPSECDKLVGLLIKNYGDIEGLEDNDALKFYNTECQLHHKRTVVTPRVLEMWGVSFKMVKQMPGDLMVLASRGMHQGMNSGLNLNYAANGICSDYHLTCAEGMEQCKHDFWIPFTGTVDKNGKSTDRNVRVSKEERYQIDATRLANLQTRSANLHYSAFPASRDRTKSELEKNAPTPAPGSKKKNLQPHMIMKVRPKPEANLPPHKIPFRTNSETPLENVNQDVQLDSIHRNVPYFQPAAVKVEVDDDTYQPQQPTTSNKKKIVRTAAIKQEINEPFPKEQYDIDKWIVEARQPTPEELGEPKEIVPVELARLNKFRVQEKRLKKNLDKSRWQCVQCRTLFVTKSECIKHISDGSKHTMYGFCQREGCAGSYHDTNTYLAHMRKHWKQDAMRQVFYDESTMSFRPKSNTDTPFKELVTGLNAKIAAYIASKPVKKEIDDTEEDGSSTEKQPNLLKRRADSDDGASNEKKPKYDTNP